MFKKINIALLLFVLCLGNLEAQQPLSNPYQEQLKMAKDDYTKALIYLQLAKDQLHQDSPQAETYANMAQAMISGSKEHESLQTEIATTLLQIKDFQYENANRANNWLWCMLGFFLLLASTMVYYFVKNQKKINREFREKLHLAKVEADVVRAELNSSSTQLEQAQNTIDQFAQINFKDLKSPLQDITNFMNLVDQKLKQTPNEDVREYISTATKNIKQIHKLLSDMVAFSQINFQPGDVKKVNLNESIFESIQKLGSEIQSKNAVIACAELPVISGNQDNMQQLFGQIISNGLIYNESKQPKLEIKHRSELNEHIFSITDNGIGIPEAYQSQAFEVFKKVHNHKPMVGNGIGLAACKKIVDQMNGKIWYTSKIDQGTTFFFTIPIEKEKEKDGASAINYNLN